MGQGPAPGKHPPWHPWHKWGQDAGLLRFPPAHSCTWSCGVRAGAGISIPDAPAQPHDPHDHRLPCRPSCPNLELPLPKGPGRAGAGGSRAGGAQDTSTNTPCCGAAKDTPTAMSWGLGAQEGSPGGWGLPTAPPGRTSPPSKQELGLPAAAAGPCRRGMRPHCSTSAANSEGAAPGTPTCRLGVRGGLDPAEAGPGQRPPRFTQG